MALAGEDLKGVQMKVNSLIRRSQTRRARPRACVCVCRRTSERKRKSNAHNHKHAINARRRSHCQNIRDTRKRMCETTSPVLMRSRFLFFRAGDCSHDPASCVSRMIRSVEAEPDAHALDAPLMRRPQQAVHYTALRVAPSSLSQAFAELLTYARRSYALPPLRESVDLCGCDAKEEEDAARP